MNQPNFDSTLREIYEGLKNNGYFSHASTQEAASSPADAADLEWVTTAMYS